MNKVLFLCREGQKRSRVAARVYGEMASEKDIAVETAVGVAPGRTRDPVVEVALNRYPTIYVMESWMARNVREQGFDGTVVNLNVKDNGYSADDPRLEQEFRRKLHGRI